ncbi:MAG: hypothetical protein KDD03_13235, partial [Gelidibacter sp.]|nr:hypothetical protein [Gelidibacter sp.]
MQKVNDYRPHEIDFTVETNLVPKTLGTFKDADKARMFIAENLLGVQTKLTTERYMDHVEIESLRDEYSKELEDVLPTLRAERLVKASELETAKKNEKDATEMVNASLNKVQQLADAVNERTTEIDLDPEFTYEICYNGKRVYYTFIDNELKLA